MGLEFIQECETGGKGEEGRWRSPQRILFNCCVFRIHGAMSETQ